jgi:hypothetical protein
VYPAIVVVLVKFRKEVSETYDLTGPPLTTIIAEESAKTPGPSIPTPEEFKPIEILRFSLGKFRFERL